VLQVGPPPPYDTAVVAGTFDRLHAGHRLLLTAAALVTTGTLYLGVTGDALTRHKRLAALLQPFAAREAAAVAHARAVRPGLTVRSGELTHPLRGIEVRACALPARPARAAADARAPRAAQGQGEVAALVVSREVAARACTLNRLKAAARALAALLPVLRAPLAAALQGLRPYAVVAVDVVGQPAGAAGAKVSSTALREADAAAAGAPTG
jgi:pantetheine-phosphate adenylyltransferase